MKLQSLYSEPKVSPSDKRNDAGWRKMELIKTTEKQTSLLEDAITSLNKLASEPPFCHIYKKKTRSVIISFSDHLIVLDFSPEIAFPYLVY